VRNYYVVFAQHDSRAGFAPTYPDIAGSTNVTVEIMPGAHSTVAMEKGEVQEAGKIVYDLAKRFLLLHRTVFTSPTLLTASELINFYAKVQIDFQKYRSKAKPDPNWMKKLVGVSATRTRGVSTRRCGRRENGRAVDSGLVKRRPRAERHLCLTHFPLFLSSPSQQTARPSPASWPGSGV